MSHFSRYADNECSQLSVTHTYVPDHLHTELQRTRSCQSSTRSLPRRRRIGFALLRLLLHERRSCSPAMLRCCGAGQRPSQCASTAASIGTRESTGFDHCKPCSCKLDCVLMNRILTDSCCPVAYWVNKHGNEISSDCLICCLCCWIRLATADRVDFCM